VLQLAALDGWVAVAAHKAKQRSRVVRGRQAAARRIAAAALSALWEQVGAVLA